MSLDNDTDDQIVADKNRVIAEASIAKESAGKSKTADILYDVMEEVLTEKQYLVFKLVGIEEMTLTEVAEIMGTSVTNIKKHFDKAKTKIEENEEKFNFRG